MELPADIDTLIEASYTAERAGNISQAFQLAQSALAQARAIGLNEPLADALVCLAYTHDRLGHHDQARSLAEEVLTSAGAQALARARALKTLGDCAHERGDLASAEEYYHRAIDLSHQSGFTYMLHRCLHSLSACVYLPRGQFELALAADAESVDLAERLGFMDEIWLPLLTMSWTLWLTGKSAQALEVALRMAQHSPSGSLAEGYYCCLRGDIAQDGDNPQLSLDWYARARRVAEQLGEPGLDVELRLSLCRYQCAFGSPSTAHQWANDAFYLACQGKSIDLQGIALLERGQAAWKLGDFSSARQDIEAAITVLASLPADYYLAQAYLALAGLFYQQRLPEAEATWVEAMNRIVAGDYGFLFERQRSLALPMLSSFLSSATPGLDIAAQRLLSYLKNESPPPLRITTLGRFAVRQGQTLLPDSVWQRKAGELFRLLLISPGQALLREQVMDALWHASHPDTAGDLFYRATSALRRALEADLPDKFPSRYLEVSQGSISLLLPAGSWVDYWAFQEHVALHEWQPALGLYQGDLFPCDLYADWAVALRETLKQQALQAAMALGHQKAALGEYEAVLSATRQALAIEPWQEEAVLLAMHAYVSSNDRIAAIRLYRQLAHSLHDELGIEPRQELQQFYRSLL
jgi:DNA-binding SARP family transcriptional activator